LKRMLLIFVMTDFLMALAIAGTALAAVPKGAGCKGIENAVAHQSSNPTEQDDAHSNIGAVEKAHGCEAKGDGK
jgi:hypothetical protein